MELGGDGQELVQGAAGVVEELGTVVGGSGGRVRSGGGLGQAVELLRQINQHSITIITITTITI